MTRNEILTRWPRASESFIRSNLGTPSPNDPDQAPKLERRAGNGPLAKSKIKGPVPTRVLVRVTSYRCRLLDEDNLCEKYACDCCRYAGLIPGDSPAEAKIEVCQEKVGSKSEERTLIEIIPFP
jgi:hypothetical protein